MKKYFILLAIVVVGCKWRYDKVVVPEEKYINNSDQIPKVYRPQLVFGMDVHGGYEWLPTRDIWLDSISIVVNGNMLAIRRVKDSSVQFFQVDSGDRIISFDGRFAHFPKIEYINPDSVTGQINMHNNLDSGKGYIFRKYQNKLPKKHIIVDDIQKGQYRYPMPEIRLLTDSERLEELKTFK